MNRTVRNRLFLALALGAAATAPRCLFGTLTPIRAAASFANADNYNALQRDDLSLQIYNESSFPILLCETTDEAELTRPSTAPAFDRSFLTDATTSLFPPAFDDLFAPPACPSGTCPLVPAPPQTLPNQALPNAPANVVRSVVRVYNAYEETISTADPALGATRRRVVEKGSGAIVADSSGTRYVLTAAHIFRDGRGQITAQTLYGRIFAATLVLASEECDVALLRVDESTDVPALTISASWPRQGEIVWRAGFGPNEKLKELAGVVKGYVKTDRYAAYETLKIDGPARQGDSGGPVYNASGEIVGVVWGTDGADAYATYCGRVLKTLCDYSPAFAPRAAQADATPRPEFEESARNANRDAAVVSVAPNANESAQNYNASQPIDSNVCDAPLPAPPADGPTPVLPETKFRNFWNAVFAFTIVFAFGYCGFFASRSR
ncbi:MAG: trypsin-like peptidase domain-containing protein [Thermoguttaceae bacterium]|nr:trypsin-like peptidase domain-containing protein [Thermoguttaceae bacterium]MBQ6829254.1 trypsin-like peptidase domain-containing protein [Thermoguttaceae bacterium]